MDAKVIWNGGLSFAATADSGFTVHLDGDVSVGGANGGFRPMELMAISLAGCTAMDVISILKKMREDVSAFEVQVHAERAEKHPKVFSAVTVDYVVQGRGVNPENVRKAIELSEVRYCPAQAMLGKTASIRHTFQVVEA